MKLKAMFSKISSLLGVCGAFLGLFAGLLSTQAQAGVTDITQLKCSQVFPKGTRNISDQDLRKFMIVVFWLNGYEAGSKRSTLVDITRVQEITSVLLSACEKNPNKTCYELLMQYDQQRKDKSLSSGNNGSADQSLSAPPASGQMLNEQPDMQHNGMPVQ